MKKLLFTLTAIAFIATANAQVSFSASISQSGNCESLEASIYYSLMEGVALNSTAKSYPDCDACEISRRTVSRSYSKGGCYIKVSTTPCSPCGGSASGSPNLAGPTSGTSFLSSNPANEVRDWADDNEELRNRIGGMQSQKYNNKNDTPDYFSKRIMDAVGDFMDATGNNAGDDLDEDFSSEEWLSFLDTDPWEDGYNGNYADYGNELELEPFTIDPDAYVRLFDAPSLYDKDDDVVYEDDEKDVPQKRQIRFAVDNPQPGNDKKIEQELLKKLLPLLDPENLGKSINPKGKTIGAASDLEETYKSGSLVISEDYEITPNGPKLLTEKAFDKFFSEYVKAFDKFQENNKKYKAADEAYKNAVKEYNSFEKNGETIPKELSGKIKYYKDKRQEYEDKKQEFSKKARSHGDALIRSTDDESFKKAITKAKNVKELEKYFFNCTSCPPKTEGNNSNTPQ